MRNAPLTVISIALLLFLSSCATSPDTQAEKTEMRMQQAADLLRNQNDADSLAAAGLLNLVKRRDQSLLLIAQATADAPERSDLLWLRIQICQTQTACDPESLERRLRTMDVPNGAGWLGALTRANKANDEQAKFAALAAISRSERIDIYWTTLIARLSRATAKTKAVSLSEAMISVIGILAAQAIPAYQVVSNACRGERLMRDDVVDVCRGIANSLMRGDTYITEMIGVAIAKRVWPENSPQWSKATEVRRTWDYRANFLIHADAWIAAHTDEYLNLCAHNRREQDVYKAELIASGKNLNPPPN